MRVASPILRRRRGRSFARCEDGLGTMEFAMLAPVLMLFVMGVVEFSLIMFTSAVMENATSNTSRLGKTGYIAAGTTRQQEIFNNVRDRTAGLLDPEKITITTKVYTDFDKVGQPEPYTDSNHNGGYDPGEPFTDINGNGVWDADMGAAGLGSAGDIVVYTVSYPWPVMTPIISNIIGSVFTITARAVIKNEPYDNNVVSG